MAYHCLLLLMANLLIAFSWGQSQHTMPGIIGDDDRLFFLSDQDTPEFFSHIGPLIFQGSSRKSYCTAVALSPRILLTAAHCLIEDTQNFHHSLSSTRFFPRTSIPDVQDISWNQGLPVTHYCHGGYNEHHLGTIVDTYKDYAFVILKSPQQQFQTLPFVLSTQPVASNRSLFMAASTFFNHSEAYELALSLNGQTRPRPKHWAMYEQSFDHLFIHTVDAPSGTSGAPLFYYSRETESTDQRPRLIGISTAACLDDPVNLGLDFYYIKDEFQALQSAVDSDQIEQYLDTHSTHCQ